MVDILALVLFHDEKLVLSAVDEAIKAGAPSKQAVLNLLSRSLDGTPPPRVNTPQALSLLIEPEADTGRYDSLRDKGEEDAA